MREMVANHEIILLSPPGYAVFLSNLIIVSRQRERPQARSRNCSSMGILGHDDLLFHAG